MAGTDTSLLLTGVTATDERDGDVTDTVTIESVIPNTDGTEASVIYVAKDSKNNVTKETRKVSYTTDAAAAVQAAAGERPDRAMPRENRQRIRKDKVRMQLPQRDRARMRLRRKDRASIPREQTTDRRRTKPRLRLFLPTVRDFI